MPKLAKLSPPKSSIAKGASFLLAGWILGTVAAICGKESEAAGVSIWSLLCTHGLISFGCGLPMFIMKYPEIQRFSSWLYVSVRSILSFVGVGAMFMALKYAKLVNVSLLSNSSPIFIPLIALVWFKTRISWKMWASILIGFLGIAFVLRPDSSLYIHPGIMLALIPGISMPFSQIYMRLMVDRGETTYAILFFYLLFMIFLSLPGAVLTWSRISLNTFWLLLIGGGARFFMQIFFIKAFTYARPVLLGPLNYSAVIFSYLAGLILWGQSISTSGFLGIILVVLGGCLTIYLDTQTKLVQRL